jgi:hypothetical protein
MRYLPPPRFRVKKYHHKRNITKLFNCDTYLLEADLLISVAKLNLAAGLKLNFALSVTANRVGNNRVVTRRNQNHLLDARDINFMILASVCGGTNDN